MTTPATTPLTYNGYVTALATLAVINTSTVSGVVQGDANFQLAVPQMLNYAELRIQRDLDLTPARQENDTYTLTAGSNKLAISTNDFVTVENIILSASGQPLMPVSKEFIQNVYGPAASIQAAPQYMAPYGGDAATEGLTSNNFLLGPTPDQAYALAIVGMVRLPTLYNMATTPLASTGTTFISTWYPDLLLMASMIYISAYQRNFGRQNDDPQMAQSYEGQYQLLLKSALGEEYRKRFKGDAWTSEAPSPVANPPR